MRITGGTLKGRKIRTCKNEFTRPLLSRLRKSLFDIIGEAILGATFLDLYAGSGAVGIEALSRGAKEAIFIEKDTLAVKTIEENIVFCKLLSPSKIWRKNVFAFLPLLLEKKKFDFIFIAPPYYKGMQDKTLDIIENTGISQATVIVQHSPREKINFVRKNMKIIKHRKYGDTILTFLKGIVCCS